MNKYDYLYVSVQPNGRWLCTIVHDQHTYTAHGETKAQATRNAERKIKIGDYETTTCKGF